MTSGFRIMARRYSRKYVSPYFFDQELSRLEFIEKTKFRFPISNHWSITTIPNGGFLSALAVRAARKVIPHGYALSLSGHFYHRTIENAESEVSVDILSMTKSSSTVLITISQEARKRCSFLVTFSFKKSNKTQSFGHSAPDLPATRDCYSASEKLRSFAGNNLRIAQRVEFRVPRHSKFIEDIASGGNSEAPTAFDCWLRYEDDRPITLTSLPFLNDCLPPPVLALVGIKENWVPTVEYSVQFWGNPSLSTDMEHHPNSDLIFGNTTDPNEQLLIGQGSNPWVRARFATSHVENGTLSTDSQIWSADGQTLLANSRQLAKLVSISSK